MAGSDIGGPGVHGLLQGDIPVGHGMNAAPVVVPSHRLGHVAVPQLRQRATFRHVVLAAVFAEMVDDVGVAADQGSQGSAGADRPQLVVVADHD
jgi:hypothetical protein